MKNGKHEFRTQRISAKMTRRVETVAADGFRSAAWEPDGVKSAELLISIDVEKIAQQLAAKAIRSKTGRSRSLFGAVEIRVIKETVRHEGAAS